MKNLTLEFINQLKSLKFEPNASNDVKNEIWKKKLQHFEKFIN